MYTQMYQASIYRVYTISSTHLSIAQMYQASIYRVYTISFTHLSIAQMYQASIQQANIYIVVKPQQARWGQELKSASVQIYKYS